MPRQRRSKLDPISRIITLGDIETEVVNDIIHSIYEINEEDIKKQTAEPIKLIINSAGGEIYSGLALIDVISTSFTPIHTICHGSAMSMGLIDRIPACFLVLSLNALHCLCLLQAGPTFHLVAATAF